MTARGDPTIGYVSFGDAFAANVTFLPDGVLPTAAGQTAMAAKLIATMTSTGMLAPW